MITHPATDHRARWALVLGIASVVLIYPLGIVVGPLAFFFGRSAVRGINRRGGTLTEARQAKVGAILGGVVFGLYLLAVLAELVAILLFGSVIPAAP